MAGWQEPLEGRTARGGGFPKEGRGVWNSAENPALKTLARIMGAASPRATLLEFCANVRSMRATSMVQVLVHWACSDMRT